MAKLQSLGIKTIFDFRTPSDVARFKSPPPVIPGINTIKAPLNLVQSMETADEVKGDGVGQYEPSNMRKFLARLTEDEGRTWAEEYTYFLTNGKDGVGAVLKCIIDRKDGEGILFHCNGTFLILSQCRK